MHDGAPLAVRVSFSPSTNERYLRTGREHTISAELSVTVSLRGATPRLSLVPTTRVTDLADDLTPTEGAFARAFDIDAEPDLTLTDELRAEIARFVMNARWIRSIAVGADGLTISWVGDGGVFDQVNPTLDADARRAVDDAETDRIRSAMRLAMHLRKHVMDALDRRAHAHVRVDAYRAPERLEDEEEEERASAARRG